MSGLTASASLSCVVSGPLSRAAGSSVTPRAATRFFLLLEATPDEDAAAAASASGSGIAHAGSSTPSTLRLIASDVRRVWTSRLDLSSLRRHRESLGIATVGWREMLGMVRACFDANRLRVHESASDASELVVTCRYTIGSDVELEGRFTLRQVDDAHDDRSTHAETVASLSASQRLLSHLLLISFTRSASTGSGDDSSAAASSSTAALSAQVSALRSEVATLRATTSTLRTENAALLADRASYLTGSSSGSADSMSSSFDGLGGDYAAGRPAAASDTSKKKPPAKPKNMSVLNPNSKRRKVGTIKIE